jgi:hypothetical protein
LLCLNGEYQEQNGEQITQYHVDVLDDEQMDVMCIFSFYMGTPTSSSAFTLCVSSLLRYFSEFISISRQKLKRDTLLPLP